MGWWWEVQSTGEDEKYERRVGWEKGWLEEGRKEGRTRPQVYYKPYINKYDMLLHNNIHNVR